MRVGTGGRVDIELGHGSPSVGSLDVREIDSSRFPDATAGAREKQGRYPSANGISSAFRAALRAISGP
jgi:hypothetical protein